MLLKASLSKRWLTPRDSFDSYTEPQSTYIPMDAAGPCHKGNLKNHIIYNLNRSLYYSMLSNSLKKNADKKMRNTNKNINNQR